MSGAPGPGQFDDPRLADALRAGDVIALTEVYDTYAPFLFDYCHGLLRDRVEAAGALRNCLIAAREHVDRLREPERLRGWLYAIARKECLRRRDSPNRHTGQEAPEADDGDLSDEQIARREERRKLAFSTLAALSGRQREAIDLSTRHELDPVDLAGLFGISSGEAADLLAETEEALATALTAALVAQNHRDDCPSASALVDGWPLSSQTAQSLARHVTSCPTCGAHEAPDLPADRLLAVLPIAAIPGDLRLDVLTAATSPDRADNRRSIAAWTEPFDGRGWPVPYLPTPQRAKERPTGGGTGRLVLAAVGGVAAVIVLAASVSAFGGGDSGPGAASVGPSQGTPSDQPSGTLPAVPPPGTSPSASPSGSPTPTSSSPSPSTSPSPSKSPTTEPSGSAPPPKPTPSHRPPPPPASLRITGCAMGGGDECKITLTAVNGPISWQVTGVSEDLNAGGTGRLGAGQSTRVIVTRDSAWCLGGPKSGSVSFSPGGAASVTWCT